MTNLMEFHYFREALNHLHFLRIVLYLEKLFLLLFLLFWILSGFSIKILFPFVFIFLFFLWIGWENYYQHEQNLGIPSRRLEIKI